MRKLKIKRWLDPALGEVKPSFLQAELFVATFRGTSEE
jgi:hypothetical protein